MTALQFIADIKWFVLVVVLLIIANRKWAHVSDDTKKALRAEALRRGWKFGVAGNVLEVTPKADQAVAGLTASDAEVAVLAEPTTLPAEEPELVQQQRREYIEEIMRISVEWGWNSAQAGHLRPPQPYIQWINGEPKIMFGLSTYPLSESPFAHLHPDRAPEAAGD